MSSRQHSVLARCLPRAVVLHLLLSATFIRSARAVEDRLLLYGTQDPELTAAVGAQFEALGIRIIVPPIDAGEPAPRTTDSTVQTIRTALESAKQLYYAANVSRSELSLRTLLQSYRETLAQIGEFDLLRELSFWRGIALAKLGRSEEAQASFIAALNLNRDVLDAARFPPQVLEDFSRAARLLENTPTERLEVETATPGAVVTVDGKPVTGTSTTLGSGPHWVVVRALGYAPVVRRVRMAGSPIRLRPTLTRASPDELKAQVDELQRRGLLERNRVAVAAAWGRQRGHAEVLVVRRQHSPTGVELSFTRVRCADARPLSRVTEPIAGGGRIEPAIRRAVLRLWPDLAVAGKRRMPSTASERPIYKRWWFWTTIGVIAVGSAAAATAVALSERKTVIDVTPQ